MSVTLVIVLASHAHLWFVLSLRKEKKYVECYWKDVQVGNFIKLRCDEVIPADMVLLHSSDPDGICHIETSSLDGETNLKQRQVVKGCVMVRSAFSLIPQKSFNLFSFLDLKYVYHLIKIKK